MWVVKHFCELLLGHSDSHTPKASVRLEIWEQRQQTELSWNSEISLSDSSLPLPVPPSLSPFVWLPSICPPYFLVCSFVILLFTLVMFSNMATQNFRISNLLKYLSISLEVSLYMAHLCSLPTTALIKGILVLIIFHKSLLCFYLFEKNCLLSHWKNCLHKSPWSSLLFRLQMWLHTACVSLPPPHYHILTTWIPPAWLCLDSTLNACLDTTKKNLSNNCLFSSFLKAFQYQVSLYHSWNLLFLNFWD